MKNHALTAIACIFLVCILSCHKDTQTKPPAGPPPPTPVKTDLTVKVTIALSGYVVNESDSPVVFAAVTAGGQQVSTDQYGYFSISSVSLPATAGLIKVISAGYFNGCQTVIPQAGKSAFVRIRLLAKKEIGTVDAASGGSLSTTDGAMLTLPAGGVVNTTDGSAYSGVVHVNARWIDPSATGSLPIEIPGDNRATDSAGYLKGLKSYGMLAVELDGAGGQLLQIASGKTAGIQIPVSTSLSGDAPASLPLWSFNDSTGLWKQEGTAIKTGNSYKGTTTHFSFWDGAVAIDLVSFTAHIIDPASHPLANVPVSITLASQPQNAGYGRFAYTDADGNVNGAIPANSSLVFQVLTPCATAAYSHPFTSAASDVDLGTLTGNLGQSEVTISGTVTNCSSQPVASGYVQTYDHGFYNRIPVTNGTFSFSGVVCSNQPVSVVAVDNGTNQQGTPQTVNLVAGTNDLGALIACGTSTYGSVTYVVDGNTYTITEPRDTINAYYLGAAASSPAVFVTQIVTLSNNPNTGQQLSFQFDGGTALGSAHSMTDVFSTAFPGGRASWPVSVPVTITEYGPVGGFVAGSINCNLVDINNTAVHTFVCNFRIRRFN